MKNTLILLTMVFFALSCGKKDDKKPTDNKVDSTSQTGINTELAAKGKEIFNINCSPCHGKTGDGDGPAGKELNPRPRNFAKEQLKFGNDLNSIQSVISEGAAKHGGSPLMRAYKDLLEKKEIEALSHFIMQLKGNK